MSAYAATDALHPDFVVATFFMLDECVRLDSRAKPLLYSSFHQGLRNRDHQGRLSQSLMHDLLLISILKSLRRLRKERKEIWQLPGDFPSHEHMRIRGRL